MVESFPSPSFHSVGLRPVSGIRSLRDEKGMLITSRRGTPFWRGAMVTGQLTLAEQTKWLSFLNRCVDLNLRIDWVHPFYALPSAYTAATWPLMAVPTLAGVTDLNTVDVAGLEVDMVLTAGDRVSISQAGVVCYREVAVGVTVTSATEQEISLSPRLPTGLFSASAEIAFEDPTVRLAVVADSWQPEQVKGPMGLSFEVEEAFR